MKWSLLELKGKEDNKNYFEIFNETNKLSYIFNEKEEFIHLYEFNDFNTRDNVYSVIPKEEHRYSNHDGFELFRRLKKKIK